MNQLTSRTPLLARCLLIPMLIALCVGLQAADTSLMQKSNWKGIDGTYWRYQDSTENTPARIQRNVFAGSKGGSGQSTTLKQSTSIPVRPAERYELTGVISTGGDLGKSVQSIEVTFLDKAGKVISTEATTPDYTYTKPVRVSKFVTAPAGAAKAQIALKADFISDFNRAGSIRFADVNLIPEKEALAAQAERKAALKAGIHASQRPAAPTAFDPEDKGPTTRGNLALGKFYKSNRSTSPAFPDAYPSAWSDGSRLTDGRKQPEGSAVFNKTNFVGWRGLSPLEVTIDLGRPQMLEEVIVNGFHSDEGYMFIPKELSVSTRISEKDEWADIAKREIAGYDTFTDTTYAIRLEVQPTQARYVKLSFQPRGEHNISTLILDQIELIGQIKNTWKKVPSEGALHGAFPTAVGFDKETLKGRSGMVVDLYEEMVGKQLAMVLWYQRMEPGRNFSEIQRYIDDELARDYYGTRFLQVGWEPRNLEDIIEGRLDDYLAQYFRDSIDPAIVGENPNPIWFRPISEFNGGWVSWGLDPEGLQRAWWRIYNIAEQVGATDHHIFVWGPNHRSYPDTEWNNIANYWPGDQYVDWVGISAYPPSTIFVKDEDRRYPVKNVDEIYEAYANYKPFMITEGAFSASVDRSRFVREWFDGLKENRPKIKIVIWENHNDRIISLDKDALNLYRELVQDPYWISETWDGESNQ